MSSKLTDDEQLELAASLTEADNVPAKIRCACCDKIAVLAFKLPCCTSNICISCHSSLADTCPVCSHNPLDANDAKPVKSLRLTVRSFLESIKKKRSKEAGGELTPTLAAPSTPVTEAIPASGVDATLEPSESLNVPVDAAVTPLPNADTVELDPASKVEATADRVAEEEAELQELEATTVVAQAGQDQPEKDNDTADLQDDSDAESDGSDIEIITGEEGTTALKPWGDDEQWQEDEQGDGQEWNQHNGMQQGGMGQDLQQMGSQGNQGDMSMYSNQMEMIQMMQNQMQNMGGNWNANMMGMPGMDMSFMNQQMMGMMNPDMMNMMMNQFGMNGMMGGMSFNGNGSFGGGWDISQMNGVGGNMNFGGTNGYDPNGGYNNQGNYPPHMSQQRHQNQQFYSKNDSFHQQQDPSHRGGRGRGRGGRGRGGFGRGNYYGNDDQGFQHGRTHSQTQSFVDNAPPPNAPTGPKAQREPVEIPHRQREQYRPSSRGLQQPAEEGAQRDTNVVKQDVTDEPRDTVPEQASEPPARDEEPRDTDEKEHEYWSEKNGTTSDTYAEQRVDRSGFRGRGRGFEGRGGWRGRGRGDYQGQGLRAPSDAPLTPTAEPKGLGVVGAPSGPKAMRERETRGGFHGRNPSFSSARQEELPTSRPRSRERERERSHRESRCHRSRTPSSDHDDSERYKERRRKHHYDDEQTVDEADDYRSSSRREHDKHRSSKSKRDRSRERKHSRRSISPEGYDSHEYASGVNGDSSKDKERKREKDKYRDRSRDRNRDRDRDRGRDRKDRDGEKDRQRSSKRDRSASPDSQHRSSHRRDKEAEKEKEKQREKSDRESRRASAASVSTKPAREGVPNVQKQLEQGFRVHGRANEREREKQRAEAAAAAAAAVAVQEPPTPVSETANEVGKMQPPSGPRSQRESGGPGKFKLDLAGLNTRTPINGPRGSAPSSRRPSQPATPTSAIAPKDNTPVDPYEAERQKAQAARIEKELARRGGNAPGLTKKRSYTDAGGDEEMSRRGGGEDRDRKRAKGRKLSYKYEDEL